MPDPLLPPSGPIYSEMALKDAEFADLAAEFLAGLPERLASMRRALERGDTPAVQRLAHQLRGSGGGYGYAMLSAQAQDLEAALQSRAPDRARQALASLERLCARLRVAP